LGAFTGTDKKFDEGLQPVMRKYGGLAYGVLNYYMCNDSHKAAANRTEVR
jgi:hypothetical protein